MRFGRRIEFEVTMKDSILIVDDLPKNLQVIAGHLGDEMYDLSFATNGEDALEAVYDDPPQLILLDINLPGISGYDVCRELKSDERYKAIPIIFLSAKSDSQDVVNGLELGAVDYVTKPFNKQELAARINTHLELYRLKREVEEKNRLLEIASLTDPLTELENRRSILGFLDNEEARINRGAPGCGIVLMDIDNFKSFNDVYGHEAGDLVLKSVSRVLKSCVRKNDRVCRWGGEEFLLVLPETSLESTYSVGEKVRASVEALQLEYREESLSITITAGCSLFSGSDIDGTIKDADDKLYLGKERGKNCVIQ